MVEGFPKTVGDGGKIGDFFGFGRSFYIRIDRIDVRVFQIKFMAIKLLKIDKNRWRRASSKTVGGWMELEGCFRIQEAILDKKLQEWC